MARQSYRSKRSSSKSKLRGATPQWRLDQDKAWAENIARIGAPPGGKGQPAPTGGPAAPKPGPPLDPVAEAQKAADRRNLALSDASSTYQLGRLEQDYGITDKSNPYARAALLEESYKRDKRGTLNSYASQGQLDSGAYGRMQGENFRNYDISKDQLLRGYQDDKANVQLGRLQSYADYGSSMTEADFAALLRAFGR